MSLNDAELIAEFVTESMEHLSDVENQLLRIEAGGTAIDLELVNTVFRAVHSVKGAAGFLGLETISRLAHHLESVLNRVRTFELAASRAVIETLLIGTDRLQALLADTATSNAADVSDLTTALNELATDDGGPTGVERASVAAAPAAAARRSAPAEAVAPAPACPMRAEPKPAAAAAPQAETSIRVSVSVLDRLMNLAGELVLNRNRLLQVIASPDKTGLEGVAAGLDQVTSELQSAIMQTRMQPLGTVFGRFARVVRDLAARLDKQCELVVSGSDVEVDKSIIEAIGDPLTHLIRNALDHGIEPPARRAAAGKPSVGTLQLSAFHQAGKVCLQIADDGVGIDPEKLKRKAVERGLLTPEAAAQLSDREAMRFIFHAGFSLAPAVTDVSGRGVGMDVVRANIEKLGGTVVVESTVGVGTTVRIVMPLTLAIIPSLIVESCGRRFAIPQVGILELVRIATRDAAERIARIKGAEVLRLRGELLPLARLDSILDGAPPGSRSPGAAPGRDARAVHVIVVEAGHLRYGLVVDRLHDSEEIVVKPLARHLKGCTVLAGATILGDGQIALILDVAGIASHAALRAAASVRASLAHDDDTTSPETETQSMLVVTNHPTEYFAVPRGMITRIERIRTDRVDSVGGRTIIQYRGASLPLLYLENHIDARARPESAWVYVIVFEVLGREIGLVAAELHDIRCVPTDIDTDTLHAPGIVGSVVLENLAVRVIDLAKLAESAFPEWYTRQPDWETLAGRKPRVLLVEDSEFFRQQLGNYLTCLGCDVAQAIDGLAAWKVLEHAESPFDLIVTDVEMPRMTGLELCERIRGHAALADVPVIALTALAGNPDIQRGAACGVNDYLIKMDRERLVEAIDRHLKERCKGRGTPLEAGA